jgi:hypothetical protein
VILQHLGGILVAGVDDDVRAETRWPIRGLVTPSPVAVTMPTPSCPGMNGTVGVTGQSPLAAWMSVWHSPDASIWTTTWPGPGSGTGRSSMTSGWPKAGTTAALIRFSLRFTPSDLPATRRCLTMAERP